MSRLDPPARALMVAFAILVVAVAGAGVTANGTTLDDVFWYLFLAALLAVLVLGAVVAARAVRRTRRRGKAR